MVSAPPNKTRAKKGRSKTPVSRPRRRGSAGTTARRPADPDREKLAAWMTEILASVDQLAARFHRDFLQARAKNTLKPKVRGELQKKLANHSDTLEKLAFRLANPPDDLQPAFRRFRDQQLEGGATSPQEYERIAKLMRMLQLDIERQRSKLAAPLDGAEERDFWRQMWQIHAAIRNLRAIVTACRKRILEPNGSSSGGLSTELDEPLEKIINGIEEYLQGSQKSRPGSATDPFKVVRAIDQFDNVLDDIRTRVDTLIESEKQKNLSKEDAALLDELRTTLDFNSCQLTLVCASVNACRSPLDPEADRLAGELRTVISRVCETSALTQTLAEPESDCSAICDTLKVDDLPDYAELSRNDREQSQFSVIVDCLLCLAKEQGPDSRFPLKQLHARVSEVANHRCVAGLGQSSLREKLKRLADQNIVRVFAAQKSRENPNASNEFRLALPAQKKYESQLSRILREFSDI